MQNHGRHNVISSRINDLAEISENRLSGRASWTRTILSAAVSHRCDSAQLCPDHLGSIAS